MAQTIDGVLALLPVEVGARGVPVCFQKHHPQHHHQLTGAALPATLVGQVELDGGALVVPDSHGGALAEPAGGCCPGQPQQARDRLVEL